MAAVYPERRSRAAKWSRRSAVFALALFVVAVAAHRLGRLDTETFLLTLGAVLVLMGLALFTLIYGFRRMWVRGDRVGTDLVAASLSLLLLMVPFGYLAWQGLTTPMLHDIVTDTENRPQLVAPKKRSAWMNMPRALTIAEAEAQLRAYPDVIGHSYTLPAERLKAFVTAMVQERGWTVVRPFPVTGGQEVTLNAVAGSLLFSLPVDVAIRVTDEDTAAYVDMRSASRFGAHDFGDNATRIRSFLNDLDAVVSATTAMPQVAQ